MKYFAPIVCFAIAAAAAYAGMFAKTFYGGGIGRLAVHNPTPRWFGRLWFAGLAAVMVYMGIRALP